MDDQLRFAALSGDRNPLHVDPVAARRSIFGRPIVHGIHLVLWAIEHSLKESARIASLRVLFQRPLGVGEAAVFEVIRTPDDVMRILISSHDEKVAQIDLVFSAFAAGCNVPALRPAAPEIRTVTSAEIAAASGELHPTFSPSDLDATFPSLVGLVPPDQIAVMLASSLLVGNQCPGLHSIYSELSCTFAAPRDEVLSLAWSVRKFDPRFSRVVIGVTGPGVDGEVIAFLRPIPQVQPSFAEICSHVGKNDYSEQRALVVGGSRGLGELCAKMLAAGGADVCLTYRTGQRDAERVAAEIEAGGGRARFLRLDVLAPPQCMRESIGDWALTHVYYFPTSPIFIAGKDRFNPNLFKEFCAVYVDAFIALIRELRQRRADALHVFYPSSVAVTEATPGMAEYAAAKSAGETACRYLTKADSGLSIRVERLPRLPTDQTASLISRETADPIAVFRDVLAK